MSPLKRLKRRFARWLLEGLDELAVGRGTSYVTASYVDTPSLSIGGTQVITSGRVLQNVTPYRILPVMVVPTDSPTIAGAISALGANGGIVYVKPGVYSEQGISVPGNVIIIGANRNTTIIRAAASATSVIQLGGAAQLYHLQIDGNGLTTKAVDASYTTSSVSFSLIEDCYIRGATSYGIDLTNNEDFTVRKCYISGNPTNIYIGGSGGAQTLQDILCDSASQQDLLVAGNTFINMFDAVFHSSVSNANIYVTADDVNIFALGLWCNTGTNAPNINKPSTNVGGMLFTFGANLYVGGTTITYNVIGKWLNLWMEGNVVNKGINVSQASRYWYYNKGDTTIHTNLTFGA